MVTYQCDARFINALAIRKGVISPCMYANSINFRFTRQKKYIYKQKLCAGLDFCITTLHDIEQMNICDAIDIMIVFYQLYHLVTQSISHLARFFNNETRCALTNISRNTENGKPNSLFGIDMHCDMFWLVQVVKLLACDQVAKELVFVEGRKQGL